uniref:Uncharacterized protein n=1 Tax=Magallana gigas TaxID=29159 RepID=K1RDC6_MAGGI
MAGNAVLLEPAPKEDVCVNMATRGNIVKGPTPSPSTGPMKAAEGKRYLYLEGSGVDAGAWSQFHMIRENDVTEGDFCLSFYYSMVGTDVGDLKVILFDSNIWNYRLKLTRSGPQIGGEWLKYEETVTMYKHTYRLSRTQSHWSTSDSVNSCLTPPWKIPQKKQFIQAANGRVMEITITSRKREREKYGHYTPENRAQCAAQ